MDKIKIYILLGLSIFIPLGILAFYYLQYNPSQGFQGSQCTIHSLTGLDCPGCGAQRSLYALMHGHLSEAFWSNALFVLGLPFLMYVYYYFIQVYIFKNEKYKRKSILSPTGLVIFFIVMSVFTILRNIPIEPFSYLSP